MISGKIRYEISKKGVVYLIKIFGKEKNDCDCVNSSDPNYRKCSDNCSQFQITEPEMDDWINIKLWCTGLEFKKVKPVEK